jgi:hypothetical protein
LCKSCWIPMEKIGFSHLSCAVRFAFVIVLDPHSFSFFPFRSALLAPSFCPGLVLSPGQLSHLPLSGLQSNRSRRFRFIQSLAWPVCCVGSLFSAPVRTPSTRPQLSSSSAAQPSHQIRHTLCPAQFPEAESSEWSTRSSFFCKC